MLPDYRAEWARLDDNRAAREWVLSRVGRSAYEHKIRKNPKR